MLVNRQAMITEIHLAGEGHHPRKYLPSKIPVHELETLVGTDDRPCVKTEIGNADRIKRPIKLTYKLVYLEILIVEKQCEDIITRYPFGLVQDARFVNKDAQRSFLHCFKQKRRAQTRHLRRRTSPASRRPRSKDRRREYCIKNPLALGMRFSQLRKIAKILFSSEARYTVTRITLFQFADTTSMSVPQFKDFSGARESASSPAFNKDQRSYSFRPKNTQIISLPTAPRQSPQSASSDQPTSAEDSRNAATRHRRESAAAMLCGGGTGNGMVSSQVASATYCAAVRKSHARSYLQLTLANSTYRVHISQQRTKAAALLRQHRQAPH